MNQISKSFKLIECPTCGEHSYKLINETTFKCTICGTTYFACDNQIEHELKLARLQLEIPNYNEANKIYKHILENTIDLKIKVMCYLGRLLSYFGVKYVKDYDGNSKITISKYDPHFKSIKDCSYCKEIEKTKYNDLYKDQLDKIDEEYKKIGLELKDEKEYDLFICTKISLKTTDNPNMQGYTLDYIEAEKIYERLKKNNPNIKIFLSEKELSGIDYDAQIYKALVRSKNMLVIATSRDYLESPWVEREWRTWIDLIGAKSRTEDSLYFYTPKGCNIEIPLDFEKIQRFDNPLDVFGRIEETFLKNKQGNKNKVGALNQEWSYDYSKYVNIEQFIDQENTEFKTFNVITNKKINCNYEEELTIKLNDFKNGKLEVLESIIQLGVQLFEDKNIPYIKEKRISLSKKSFNDLIDISIQHVKKHNKIIKDNLFTLANFILTFENLPFNYEERRVLAEKIYNVLSNDNANALYKLGELYGDNIDIALEYYIKALNRKSELALLKIIQLANNYFYGLNIAQDYSKALKLYLIIEKYNSEKFSSFVQCQIGIIYKNGFGIDVDHNIALDWLQKSVAQNDLNAAYEIGDMFYKGIGVKQDFEEALKWFNLSVDNPKSKHIIGNMYYNGNVVDQSFQEAVKWYAAAANQNYSESQYALALCFKKGVGVEQNFEEAARLFLAAANQEHIESQYEIGKCFIEKLGVEYNIESSINWFILAANQGHIESQYQLGNIYFDSKGEAHDYAKAFHWYKIASDNSHLEAQVSLGECYFNGLGTDVNYDEAYKIFKNTYNTGNIKAQIYLGKCYLYGYGIKNNPKGAFRVFKLAADSGNIEAMLLLADCYAYGIGTNKNYEEVYNLTKRVSETGNAEGQFYFGCCFMNGWGTEKNNKEACKWFELSAAQGYEVAMYELSECYNSGQGVEANIEKMHEYLSLAADKDYPPAIKELARIYFEGNGVKKDYVKSYFYYEKLIKRENLNRDQSDLMDEDWGNIAFFYYEGIVVEKDLKKALDMYKLASKNTNNYAEEIANIYYSLENFHEAFKYYNIAIKEKRFNAFRNLAYMYEHAKGTNKNVDEAIRLYKIGKCYDRLADIYSFEKKYINYSIAMKYLDTYLNSVENNVLNISLVSESCKILGKRCFKKFLPNFKKAYKYLSIAKQGIFVDRETKYLLGEMYYWGLGTKKNREKAYEIFSECLGNPLSDSPVFTFKCMEPKIELLKTFHDENYDPLKDKKNWTKTYKKAFKAINRHAFKKYKNK